VAVLAGQPPIHVFQAEAGHAISGGLVSSVEPGYFSMACQIGTVALCLLPTVPSKLRDAPLVSDGEREVVKCHAEPGRAGDFGSNVVVAAAEVLHEGMTGSEDLRRAVPMRSRIEELWKAYSGSEEEWQAARGRLREAIQAFNAAVRQEVQR
jgi:hypothetical protein